MSPIPRFIPSTHKEIAEISQLAMQSEVAQKLAKRIAEDARRIANESGHPELADAVTVTSARPKGRGQIQIIIDDGGAAAVEWGDNETEKARILGRAAGVQLFPDSGGEP